PELHQSRAPPRRRRPRIRSGRQLRRWRAQSHRPPLIVRQRQPDDKTALTLPAPENLERVRIVLVEPRTAVNIGASARAMSTMGLRDLCLVRPAVSHLTPGARSVAHNAVGVLEKARCSDTVLAACAEAVLVIGTTNRRRSRVAPDPIPIRAA